MSQLLYRVDPTVVTATIRLDWNRWNKQERSAWLVAHGMSGNHSLWDFDDLHEEIQDALFCEFLDLAQKDFE